MGPSSDLSLRAVTGHASYWNIEYDDPVAKK